ncbi:MAG: hypothetical protein EP318_19435 [Rhodobacteraceae bacterium]|nr:MAG: hypothetical protein EP318_19435 [Paracoccaceae bacterium]
MSGATALILLDVQPGFRDPLRDERNAAGARAGWPIRMAAVSQLRGACIAARAVADRLERPR